MDVFLHHVSVVTTDLARAMAFYCDVLGMQPIERPPFSVAGAWLAVGSAQVHLIDHVDGTFRGKNTIDNNDVHFALRVPDFESALKELAAKGYHEDLEENDPKRVLVRRTGLAGFPQAYLIDPDQHVVEINAEA
jgi:glyoxylase I family protein